MRQWFVKNRMIFLKAVVLGLLPLLCCVVTCAMQGKSIFDIYLPASDWNDELFYYKQVEGMLSFGYPRGYFGFNESHALKLSFAAWSPVLVFPWLLWGVFFGWNMMSPILCNIFAMTVAVVLFVILAKPSWKQTGLIGILFCVFTPYVNYMLRGMPEALCFSMVIVYYAFMLHYQENEDVLSLVFLFLLAGIMTLMRPYLVLFCVYPAYRWICRQKWIGAAGSFAILVVVLAGYVAIKHYLGAEYFTPLFQTEWLTPFLQGDIWQGLKGVVAKLLSNGSRFVSLTIEGTRSGLAEGAYFGGYMTMLVLFVWQAFAQWRKENKKKTIEYAYLTLCFVGMLGALLLMYKMKEGSKHLITFMAAGVFAVAMMETRMYKKAMLLSVVCVYLFSIKATSAMDYALPFVYSDRQVQMEAWDQIFKEKLSLLEGEEPSYDNTVIWVFSDEVDGESVLTDWQVLYALPKGFGVNCCYADYVKENFGRIKSRYILIPKGSELEAMCIESGRVLIGEDSRVCMYMLRDSYGEISDQIVEEIYEEGKQSVFFSAVPLLEDKEETFAYYRGVSVVARDLSRLTEDVLLETLETTINSGEIQDMFLWLLPETLGEELYGVLTNARAANKEIMLYAPSLKTLAAQPDEQRYAYYDKVREAVSRLASSDTILFWLGDQEWFLANDLNYTSYDTMNSDVEEHVLIQMHCDRHYVIDASNVEEKIYTLEQYVQRYRMGDYDGQKYEEDIYVFFGDSVVGNNKDSTSIPEVVRYYTGATVWNQGIGGISASADNDEALSGYAVVDDFVKKGIGIDLAGDTVFFLNFGLNDYMSGRVAEGSGTDTYEGALCRMVEIIREEYEDSEIVIISPSFISYYDCGTSPTGPNGNVLEDFVSVAADVAKRYETHFFDSYHEMGVTRENAEDYLVDMVHHTEQGRFLFGQYICKKMEEVVYE